MHAKLLNRARPLWEFYVFEGMENNEIGLYSKIHHACIDGGAGAALTNMIYDISPEPREVPKPAEQASSKREPRDIAAHFIDSYQQLWSQPLGASSAKDISLPRIGKGDLGSVLFDNAMFQIENAVKFAGNFPAMLKSMSEMASRVADPKSRDSIAGMMSPSTELNKAVSSERSYATVSISLSQAKDIAKKSGGKLNDVVLALSSGVLRRYLLERGTLPGRPLTAAVPISLREDGNADANNQVFAMVCSLATQIEDPKERLQAIIGESTQVEGAVASDARAGAAAVQRLDAGRADRRADPGACSTAAPIFPTCCRRRPTSPSPTCPDRGRRSTPRAPSCCTSSRCRSRRMGSRSTSRCRAIATISTSASLPVPMSFQTCGRWPICCRRSSSGSRRPMPASQGRGGAGGGISYVE